MSLFCLCQLNGILNSLVLIRICFFFVLVQISVLEESGSAGTITFSVNASGVTEASMITKTLTSFGVQFLGISGGERESFYGS